MTHEMPHEFASFPISTVSDYHSQAFFALKACRAPVVPASGVFSALKSIKKVFLGPGPIEYLGNLQRNFKRYE
jgi:hypothetical protein